MLWGNMQPHDIPDIGPQSLRSWRFWLHFPRFVKLYWRLFRDRRVALLPKIILVAGLLYLICPDDLIPDILGPIGFLDDAIVLAIVLRGFMALCPRTVVEEHVRLITEGA